MFVLFTASCLALILVYLGSKDKIPYGLELAFCVVTFIAAIHYNYGNDYKEYMYVFNKFARYDFDLNLIMDKKFYKEPGWTFICFLFQPLGFYSLVAFLAILQNYIYYLFIKEFVPKNWWILAVFIYLFSDSLWVLNMSMMRQGLSVSLFVLAWIISARGKKYIPISFFIVLVATTIHSSALLILPFLLLLFLKKEYSIFYAIGVSIFMALFFIKPDLFSNFLFVFMDDFDDNISRLIVKYENENSSDSFGFGFAIKLSSFFIMVFCLIKCRFNLDEGKMLSNKAIRCIAVALFSVALLPVIKVNVMAGRFVYYFVAFLIPAIPLAYKEISIYLRIPFLGILIFYYVYCYVSFFYSPVWMRYFAEFHSIFEILF